MRPNLRARRFLAAAATLSLGVAAAAGALLWRNRPPRHREAIRGIVASADLIVSFDATEAVVSEAVSSERLRRLNTLLIDSMTAACMAPTADVLVAAHGGSISIVHSIRSAPYTQPVISVPEAPSFVAASRDSSTLAIGLPKARVVRVVRRDDASNKPLGLAVEGTCAAVGSESIVVGTWGQGVVVSSGDRLVALGPRRYVAQLALDSTGRRLAVSTTAGIEIWDLAEKQRLRQFAAPLLHSLQWLDSEALVGFSNVTGELIVIGRTQAERSWRTAEPSPESLTASCIAYEPDAGTVRLLLGTADGHVYSFRLDITEQLERVGR